MDFIDDLNYGLAAFGIQIPKRIDLDAWAASLAEKPFQNTATIVGVSSVLFLLAEHGHNPKVNSIYDAMIYCSTCLNVGYADIFPRTPVGKLIGSFLMVIGPSMATKTTDGSSAAPHNSQEHVLELLQRIAAELGPDGKLPSPPSVP
jgi:hypothetical protein